MITFTKFPTLPPELRSHALSFNSKGTLVNYAQCSKQCNEDFGKQHIPELTSLHIYETETEITVHLWFGERYYKFIFQKSGEDRHFLEFQYGRNKSRPIYREGNFKQVAAKYVRKRLKYNRNEKNFKIKSRLKTFWPFDAIDTRRVVKNCSWDVTLYAPMFEGFYDTIRNGMFENDHLELWKCTNPPFDIPSEFFKTSFFQNANTFLCSTHFPELDSTDFLTMKASVMRLNSSSFSDEVINKKLCQCFTRRTTQVTKASDLPYYYFFRENIAVKFDKQKILMNLPVTRTRNDVRNSEIIILTHEHGVEIEMDITENYIYFNFRNVHFSPI